MRPSCDRQDPPSAPPIGESSTPPKPAAGENPEPSRNGGLRTVIAVLIGLAGSLAIWVATPYNNFLLGSSFIADDYLPVSAIFLILVIVLAVNPFLRWLRPTLSLSTAQLAIVLGILLVACVIPSHGLLRMLPYMIAKAPSDVSEDRQLAAQYEKMDLPDALFPDRPKFRSRPQASESFTGELPPGAPIPWKAWVRPLVGWGVFLAFCWMMMVGQSLIMLPQWRNNERLAFPLLTVQQALIQSPDEGKLLAPLFRKRSFWAAAGAVFILHFLSCAKVYYPDSVPAVPLKWDLTALITGEPWGYLPGHLKTSRIYFIFLGIAFFMPNRIAFSIWFTIVAYGFYRLVGLAYLPPYYHGTIADHRTGAMIALTLAILYVGRAQWARTFSVLFVRPASDEDRRNRDSGWMFLLGLCGMFAWLVWMGVEGTWALLLVAFAFMVALLVSRIVAETGMPFWRIHADAMYLMKLAPLKWISPVTLFFSWVVTVLFPQGSRVSPATMAIHGAAMDNAASPRRQWRMGLVFMGVLLLGLVVCGAVHLNMSYRHSGTVLEGKVISEWGTGRLTDANKAVKELGRGQLSRPPQNVPGHIAFGAVLAGVLYWLSLNFPTWPLHPVGLLLIETPSYGNLAWTSIFIGWLLKVTLVRFGGAMAYRAARPVFLGVIMGEVFAAVFWAAVPAALFALGVDFKPVDILPR